MGQRKQHGEDNYNHSGLVGAKQDLKGVAAEHHFFADDAKQKQDAHKEEAAGFIGPIRSGLERGQAEDQRQHRHDERAGDAERRSN